MPAQSLYSRPLPAICSREELSFLPLIILLTQLSESEPVIPSSSISSLQPHLNPILARSTSAHVNRRTCLRMTDVALILVYEFFFFSLLFVFFSFQCVCSVFLSPAAR